MAFNRQLQYHYGQSLYYIYWVHHKFHSWMMPCIIMSLPVKRNTVGEEDGRRRGLLVIQQ
jgi:hypothetical protein